MNNIDLVNIDDVKNILNGDDMSLVNKDGDFIDVWHNDKRDNFLIMLNGKAVWSGKRLSNVTKHLNKMGAMVDFN